MLLEPIASVSSVGFYERVSRQSVARSFGYLCYVGALFAVAATFALKLKLGPALDETFDWLAKTVPPMTYADGRLSSTSPMPVKLQSPRLPELAFIIDTTRTEPVSPDQIEQAKVMAYVTSNTFYVRKNSGQVEVYPLSRPGQPGADKPLQIDPAFFKTAGAVLSRVLYPLALGVIFGLFFFWKLLASLLFSLVALLVNALAGAAVPFRGLFSIAVYAQTLVIGFQAVSLFLPFTVPGATAISLAVTGLYIWLAVKRHRSSASASSEPQPQA